MNTSRQNFVSPIELARHLGITPMAVLKRIWSGRIKAEKIDHNYAISRKYIEENYPQISLSQPTSSDHSLNKPTPQDYFSVIEVARIMGISRVAVFKKIKNGQLSAQKVGRHYIIPKSEVSSVKQLSNIQKNNEHSDVISIPDLVRKTGVSRFVIMRIIKQNNIDVHRKSGRDVISSNDVAPIDKALVSVRFPEDKFVSVVKAGEILGISRVSVFKMIQQGKIKALKVGHRYSIRVKDIEELKSQRESQ